MFRKILRPQVVPTISAITLIAVVCGCVTTPRREARSRFVSLGVHPEDLSLEAEREGRVKEALRDCAKLELGGFFHNNMASIAKPRKNTITFLHISDAQVRDEAVQNDVYSAQLEIESKLHNRLDSLMRPILVERWDQLRLAAIVCAAANQDPAIPYVIHTGDLLDFSLWSELRQVVVALRLCNDKTRIYSVVGNHDGQFFGNFHPEGPLVKESPGDLVVNANEFVLAHLAVESQGFGFARNEYIRQWNEFCSHHPKAMGCDESADEELMSEMLAHRNARSDERGLEENAAFYIPPLSLRRIYRGWSDASRTEESLLGGLRSSYEWRRFLRTNSTPHLPVGYYSFDMENHACSAPTSPCSGARSGDQMVPTASRPPRSAPVSPRLRAIVLDTHSLPKEGHREERGSIDLAQLGWLYTELAKANAERLPVVIFAHHEPFEQFVTLGGNRTELIKLLKCFNQLIIGYFHGHDHVNKQRDFGKSMNDQLAYWIVQTGSLADFPQCGRLVYVEMLENASDSSGVRITLTTQLVRGGMPDPIGTDESISKVAALIKDALEESSLAAAYDEYFRQRDQKEASSFIAWLDEWHPESWVKEDIVISFFEPTRCPSASEVFGDRLVKKINAKRFDFGLQGL